MKLYRPIKTFMRTQRFGENLNPYYKSVGMRGHSGEDWKLWEGEPIYHGGDWEGVAQTEVDRDGGIGVDVFSKDKQEDLGLVKLRYWHLQKVAVYDGQKILPGQLIGYGDSTGISTGHHLHFALKQVNSRGRTLNTNNGYYGGIDFSKWFDHQTFVLDVLGVEQQRIALMKQIVKLYTQIIDILKGRKSK